METLKEYWHIIEVTIGALFALFAWFVKDAINNIKEKIHNATSFAKENHDAINQVKLDYVLKADFKEFRDELWNRLDRLEDLMRRNQ